jgi:hypothetical protein
VHYRLFARLPRHGSYIIRHVFVSWNCSGFSSSFVPIPADRINICRGAPIPEMSTAHMRVGGKYNRTITVCRRERQFGS